MAKLAKPGTKGSPPPPKSTAATTNTQRVASDKKIQIPIMAYPELRREYKAYCAEHDITMCQQFEDMFAFWKAHHS
ncbi:hypothetical protein [uncultured Cohaesibacter sp.]|uniref:hypothetical protein n=1 Tax=uncultured Cohaesibacter sp. TaxID=1002546 RepID=UPI00292D9262|nr:hypothetical protein [uncultured Cohaesibacter sp.]